MAASLIVRIGANLDELKKALSESKSLIQQSTDSMDRLATKLSQAGAKAGASARDWAGAITKVGDATKFSAAQLEQADRVFDKARAYPGIWRDLDPEVRKVADAIKGVVEQNRALEARTAAAADALRRQGQSLKDLGAGLTSVGRGFTVNVTAPLLGIGAAAFRAADQVNEGLFAIRQATGATGQRFADLKQVFEEVYRTVPQQADIVGKAIGDIAARTGRTGTALADLSTQLLNLAQISRSEVAPLVAATTRLFGDWSISTEKQSAALDYLWRASQATGIQVQRLSELVVQFGAPMRALGFSFEQAAAMLGKWEKEGVNIETILSGLRFALGKFAAAGVDPQRALLQITAAIKGAKTEAEATSIAFQTFGKRAAVDMGRAILEGRLDIEDLVGALRAGQGTINETEKATQSFAEQMVELGHSVDLALAPLGQELQRTLNDLIPLLTDVAKTVENLLHGFAELPRPIQNTVLATAGLAAAFGPLALAAGAAISGVGNLILILDRLRKAHEAAAAAGGIAGSVDGIGTAATAATPLVARLTAALVGLAAVAGPLLALRGLAGSWKGAFEDMLRSLRGLPPINIPAHLAGLDQLPKPLPDIELPIEVSDESAARAKAAIKAQADLLASLLKGAGGESAAQKVAKEIAALGALWTAAKAHGADLQQVIEEKGNAFISAGREARIWGVAVSDAFAEGLAAAQAHGIEAALADLSKGFAGWAAEARKAFGEAGIGGVEAQTAAMGQNLDLAIAYQQKLDDLGQSGLALRLQQIERERQAELRKVTAGTIGAQEATSRINAVYDQQVALATGTADTIIARMRGIGIGTREDLATMAAAARRDYEQMRESGEYTAEQLRTAWQRWYDADRKARGSMTTGWLASLGQLAGAFQQLAQIAGGSLGEIARGIGTIVGAMKLAGESLDQTKRGFASLKEGFSLGGLTDIVSGFAGIAAAALEAGKAIAGFFSALFGHHTEKDIKRKLSEWGLAEASDELVQQIADDVKKLGGEVESSIFHLADIIEEAGGVTAANFGTYIGKLRDVFVMVGTGKFDTARAKTVIDQNFNAFLQIATEAATKTGGILDARLRDIIRLDKVFGTGSEQINAFVTAQLANAQTGLAGFLALHETANHVVLASQAATEGFGAALGGIFAEMTARGMPLIDVLKQLEPAVEALAHQLEETGFTGGAAFDDLRAKIALMKDSVTGPLLQGIQGIGQGLAGLFNAQLLSPEMWAGLTQQIGSMWRQMGDKGQAALALMQPQLQAIWEIAQETGWAVDETTRAMLDEAEAAGLVGAAHKSANQQMIDGINRLGDGIRALVKGFGFDLPDSMRQAEREIKQLLPPDATPQIDTAATGTAIDQIQQQLDDLSIPIVSLGWTEAGGTVGRKRWGEMHTGGLVLAGRWPQIIPRAHGGLAPDEFPVILQSGEGVLSRRAVAALGAATVDAWNRGEAGPTPISLASMGAPRDQPIQITVVSKLDGRTLAKELITIVRRLGGAK